MGEWSVERCQWWECSNRVVVRDAQGGALAWGDEMLGDEGGNKTGQTNWSELTNQPISILPSECGKDSYRAYVTYSNKDDSTRSSSFSLQGRRGSACITFHDSERKDLPYRRSAFPLPSCILSVSNCVSACASMHPLCGSVRAPVLSLCGRTPPLHVASGPDRKLTRAIASRMMEALSGLGAGHAAEHMRAWRVTRRRRSCALMASV